MKILIAGDCHGNLKHARFLAEEAVERGCDAIFQIGDWGYIWPGNYMLLQLEDMLASYDMHMYWLDGNHEDFGDMKARYAYGAEDMQRYSEHVTYVPRGHTWDWDGVAFMAMGGAWSIDQDIRTPGASWWGEEIITYTDVARAEKNMRKIDVFLSHDAPTGVPKLEASLQLTEKEWRIDPRHFRGSKNNRDALWDVVRQAKPEILYHGHYHHHYMDILTFPDDGHRMRVIGLSWDGDRQRSFAVMDTANWRK